MSISTITTKGQVVIPAQIREEMNLIPSTRVKFELKDGVIIAKPILTVEQAYGMFASDRKDSYTEEDYKRSVREAIMKKHKFRSKR